jgi:ABC-2 type transport system ATP-binding protein
MLKVTNLRKKYGSLEVLKGISFEIDKGKIYGFLGQNGAGKTTTMNILTGLIDFNGGEIYLEGKDFKKHKRELLTKVGYLTQNPVFYNYMNAYEYLRFIGEINGMFPDKIKKRTDELLEIVKLKDAAKRKLGGYSGGMKQRFGLAVSMFNNPQILFLDEPTSALDPEGRMEVLDLIEQLKNDGITVFLSTHILSDIERVCDEVSIIDKGKIIVSQGLEELKNNYIQPIYDIEFENNCVAVTENLSKIDWVEDMKVNKNKVSIYVKDVDTAKSKLIGLVNSNNNPIVSFNLRKSTLEDIFIRLVNRNVNI